LIQFGKEVMATHHMLTYCTERMADFLRANGPWAQLVRDEHLSLNGLNRLNSLISLTTPTSPTNSTTLTNSTIRLTDQLTIRPFLVPHRQEWSDTIGLEIIGPHKRVLYIPDIDRWSDWECDVCEVVSQCDIALLDGSFYAGDELPGRDMSHVPHPLITDSMERLAGLSGVYFTHLNHTNPALNPESSQRKEIEARGFHVAEDRMEFEL
jgi:pyrroloquinoline quinone biosynthesis protein B